MNQARFLPCLSCAALMFTLAITAPAASGALLGINGENGDLYRISETNASLNLIGNTGVALAGLEQAPDGTIYGYTAGAEPWLYTLDPATATVTPVTRIGDIIFLFEGSIAFSPAGVAYSINMSNEDNNKLFTFDLTTGAVNQVIALSGGPHDVNGMVWRSDGKLVGLDQAQNALIEIDPDTGDVSLLRSFSIPNPGGSAILGANGGMTVMDGVGYFATGGSGATLPGSNELYQFDLFTGDYSLVGSFTPGLAGKGISALAVPEPATIAVLTVGCLVMLRPRRRAAWSA